MFVRRSGPVMWGVRAHTVARIADARLYRAFVIFGALAVNLLLISAGVIYDVYVMNQERREGMATFHESGRRAPLLCPHSRLTVRPFPDALEAAAFTDIAPDKRSTLCDVDEMSSLPALTNPAFAAQDVGVEMDSFGGRWVVGRGGHVVRCAALFIDCSCAASLLLRHHRRDAPPVSTARRARRC